MSRLAFAAFYVLIGLGAAAYEYRQSSQLPLAMFAWAMWPCSIGFVLFEWSASSERSETPPKAANP